MHLSLVEAPGPNRSALSRWRSLPLTAQLLVVGMAFSMAWFLVARAAAEQQLQQERQRQELRASLSQSELTAMRLGTALNELALAHRGFLLNGDNRQLSGVGKAWRTFDEDLEELRAGSASGRVQHDLIALRRTMDGWRENAFTPNVARRRGGGLNAFDVGTPGAAGFQLSTVLIGRARELQAGILSEIRFAAGEMDIANEIADAQNELILFLIWAGALAVFLLVLTLLLRLVARSLSQVIGAAQALEAGRYQDVRLPDAARAPNMEIAQLATTFERLAGSIEQREQQLRNDVERLKELELLKRDFVSTVSHELRTPLTSMRGALGLILGGKVGVLPAKGKELLAIAMTNTERLIRLINDILDVEKMDAGQVSVRRDRLRLRPLIETTLAGLESYARDHEVTLVLAPSAQEEAEVIGDADRLVQVFTNLVSNSVKYSPKGAQVELSIVAWPNGVMVRVRDHGPGIPKEFAERIFGRFQQAEDADSRKSGGTGLGLNISQSIIEMHSGRIGFEPAAGGGTTFWVTLPVVAPVMTAVVARHQLLIIEDDPSMRDVLVAQFAGISRPLAVQSAEAALELLERERVGAIILDPGLPGMDGLTFAARLRKDPKLRTLPVFLYSAKEYGAEELRAAGIRAADAFVKSRDSDVLLFERLRHELSKREQDGC